MVEQRTENPRVIGSTPILGTIDSSRSHRWVLVSVVRSVVCLALITSGSSSAVERLLAKEEVASSNLVFRSSLFVASGGAGEAAELAFDNVPAVRKNTFIGGRLAATSTHMWYLHK